MHTIMLRDNHRIRDDIIHERHTHGSRITEVIHLNRCTSAGENSRAAVSGIAVQIDRDIDFELPQKGCNIIIAGFPDIDEAVEYALDPAAHFASIAWDKGNAGDFKACSVVVLQTAH